MLIPIATFGLVALASVFPPSKRAIRDSQNILGAIVVAVSLTLIAEQMGSMQAFKKPIASLQITVIRDEEHPSSWIWGGFSNALARTFHGVRIDDRPHESKPSTSKR